MRTITDRAAIAETLAKFEPDPEGATPTCATLPGQWERENMQEWTERGTVEGAPARVFYLFENAEASDEDASNYPFDEDHVDRIEIAEKDQFGDFDEL